MDRRPYTGGEREAAVSVITLTDVAVAAVREIMARDGRDETFALRLEVVGDVCAGLEYRLAFDDQVGDGDREWEQNGVRVVVSEASAPLLAGTTIDYVDDANDSGFRIDNPNTGAKCGCGQNFSS
jgi:iron-sulfur cluster assembly protein